MVRLEPKTGTCWIPAGDRSIFVTTIQNVPLTLSRAFTFRPLSLSQVSHWHPDKIFSVSFSLIPTRGEVAGWAVQLLLRAFLTRPPERAKTRSLPKRALSHRARSGSNGMPWL